jgi:hypothetical protein
MNSVMIIFFYIANANSTLCYCTLAARAETKKLREEGKKPEGLPQKRGARDGPK